MGGGPGGGILRCCLEDEAVRDFGAAPSCVGREAVERVVFGIEDGRG